MSQFTKKDSGNHILIQCPKVLDEAAATDFNSQSKAWLLGSVEHFVLDLEAVETIEREFYKAVLMFKTTLRRDEKTVSSINIKPELLQQVRDDGVEPAFRPIRSLSELKAKAGTAAKAPLNVAFINPFLVAVQKTLEVQCKTKVKILKPYLKKESVKNIAIASVLALNSNNFSGSVVLCFSESVFLKIYENMFEEKVTTITPEIQDAAGELLNIIYGMAKIELNKAGYNFLKALPTVMAGEQINVRYSGAKPAVVIPFETDVGEFHLEIEFEATLEGKNV